MGVIILPLIFYCLKFGSVKLSSDFEDWVNFSTYWSPYLVAALTIVLAYISWQGLELMKLKEKPLLVVERIRGTKPVHSTVQPWIWKVKNIGLGPAIEVKLFIIPEKPFMGLDEFLRVKSLFNEHLLPNRDIDYDYLVHSISITPNSELLIDWHSDLVKLTVSYYDLNGKDYVSTYSKSGKTDSEKIVLSINNEGKSNGKVLFSTGTEMDKALGPKRVFSIGECFI
jgi:hypothetical protein